MVRNILIVFIALIVFFSCSKEKPEALIQNIKLGEFGAFYTKINSGEEFEKFSRTGSYADIVVDLGEERGAVVFWRGTSYLPYQITPFGDTISFEEVVPRSGNGNDVMPDKTNMYSVVKIIENTPEKVIVHWRYLPEFTGGNPNINVTATGFCEEYFTFFPNGEAERTIRKGEEKIDAWKDPSNMITQKLIISKNGIEVKESLPAKKIFVATHVAGNPIFDKNVVEPAVWFRFDEAKGDSVTESVSGIQTVIPGSKTQWRKGVSGTAIQFDGHKNFLKLSAKYAPKIKDAITLEGWAAMAAYPWSWTTIVQQMDDVPEVRKNKVDNTKKHQNERFSVTYEKEDDRGYFLGINGLGQAGFKIRINEKWEELTSKNTLEKDKLNHFAASYDKATGKMLLYVNGILDCEKQVAKASIETSSKDIFLAKGKDRAQIGPVRASTYPAPYTFDGIIDEVKIYTSALSADQIAQSYQNYNVAPETMADMEVRKIPTGEDTDKFGARYTFLKFYDSWENLWRTGKHADVVVEFEKNPGKVIFWRGMSYIEMIVNEANQFYSNEFNEIWGKSGGTGCMEPMSDKGVYSSHVRIIENTEARVVLEWRFALQDVNYILANYEEETGWGDWSSWYYYIYPDGITVKTQQLWCSSDGRRNHEWQEAMAIFSPNQHPHDVISRKKTLTFVGFDGESSSFDWLNKYPDEKEVRAVAKEKPIQVINFTGEYDPVTIVSKVDHYTVYKGELTDYAVFCTWNHWPVAQQPSDGRYAIFPDRTSHSSLTHTYYPVYEEVSKEESLTPYRKKIMMQGMLNLKPKELSALANSWVNPPALINAKECKGEYDKAQRAYIIQPDADQFSFTLNCSESSPLYNAALIIKNRKAKATITINGNEHPTQQEIIRDTDGAKTLVVWMEKKTNEKINIVIKD